MVNIDWKDLPRTFRHAIEFTRFLRVRYIWIDSLCIIQDKDWLNDWFHEAGFMQDVYQGSFLNLAADSASDSTQGLFRIRNARLEQPCYISLTGDTALQDGSKEYKLYESSSWRIQVAKSPLAKRSWYLQERLLAPRILHFGSQQLLWECHQQTAAETFPNGLPKSMDIRASFRFKAFSWSSITPEDVFDRTWPDIFEAYTVSQLTNPGDKLIALSGVSKKLQSRVESPYIAGLWEANLILQLCWRVDVHYEELPQRPLHYRAPSFSWACLDAPVQNPVFQNATYCAEVVQASATPVADDCYGAVKDAFVLLRCPLKLTRLELLNLGHGRPKVEVLLDAGGPKRGDAYLDSPGIDLERKDIYAATLVLYEIDEWDNIFGLLLEPYGLDGIFKRIGLFNYCLLSDPVSKILAPSPDATNFPCEHFDRATGKHTIRLI